jgi:hypothetical protein
MFTLGAMKGRVAEILIAQNWPGQNHRGAGEFGGDG